MSTRSLAVVLLLAGLLGGCASRYVEPGSAAASSLSHGNATVSKVTYFAAWVDERGPAEPAAASPAPAATPAAKPAASDKRGKRKSPPAAAGAARAEAAPVQGGTTGPGPAARPAPPQPRYEYTVELDGGGVQTLVGHRDLGIRVNDRVLVQDGTVTALAN